MDFGYKVSLVLLLNNILSYLIPLQNLLPLPLGNISLRHSKESKNVKGHAIIINDEGYFFKNFKVHMSKLRMALKLKLLRRLCINYT